MAEKGNIFDKTDFDFEKDTLRLASLDSGTILQIKDYHVFYSAKYEATFAVIEDHKGNYYSTFSSAVVDRVVKAVNMGLTLKKRVVQVFQKETEDKENTYSVLEVPASEDLNKWNQARYAEFQAKRKAEKEKE